MLHFTLTLPSALPKDFKRKARRYWDVKGCLVGDLLSFHHPQTLPQLQEAYPRRYGRYPRADHTIDHYLAHTLLRLAEHGFVRIEPAVPFPLDTPPLAFHLALPPSTTAAVDKTRPVCNRLVTWVLATGKPMTLDQVIAAVQQAAKAQDTSPAINMRVAGCLLMLAEAGVVEVLQAELLP